MRCVCVWKKEGPAEKEKESYPVDGVEEQRDRSHDLQPTSQAQRQGPETTRRRMCTTIRAGAYQAEVVGED